MHPNTHNLSLSLFLSFFLSLSQTHKHTHHTHIDYLPNVERGTLKVMLGVYLNRWFQRLFFPQVIHAWKQYTFIGKLYIVFSWNVSCLCVCVCVYVVGVCVCVCAYVCVHSCWAWRCSCGRWTQCQQAGQWCPRPPSPAAVGAQGGVWRPSHVPLLMRSTHTGTIIQTPGVL